MKYASILMAPRPIYVLAASEEQMQQFCAYQAVPRDQAIRVVRAADAQAMGLHAQVLHVLPDWGSTFEGDARAFVQEHVARGGFVMQLYPIHVTGRHEAFEALYAKPDPLPEEAPAAEPEPAQVTVVTPPKRKRKSA